TALHKELVEVGQDFTRQHLGGHCIGITDKARGGTPGAGWALRHLTVRRETFPSPTPSTNGSSGATRDPPTEPATDERDAGGGEPIGASGRIGTPTASPSGWG
ncbi:MAG: hypothetical protein ACOYOM_15635, partial [Chloroflexota bacterium]